MQIFVDDKLQKIKKNPYWRIEKLCPQISRSRLPLRIRHYPSLKNFAIKNDVDLLYKEEQCSTIRSSYKIVKEPVHKMFEVISSAKIPELTIGIDLGGTKINIAIIDTSGNAATIVDRLRIPTNTSGNSSFIINDIASAVKQLEIRLGHSCSHLSVAVAGQVETDSGLVTFAPNLKWRDVPLKTLLENCLAKKVFVVNDVRAATFGEWMYGIGKRAQDAICLFIGTGIGGGIVSKGQLLQGSNNCAGEFGHIVVKFGGRLCGCGNRGCLEAFASGTAIGKAAREAAENSPTDGKALISAAGGYGASINGSHVSMCAKNGDLLATQILYEALEALIAGTTSIVNSLNPEIILFGGGVIAGNPDWIEKIADGVRKCALPSATKKLRIAPTTLGEDCVLLGAVGLRL